MANTDTAGAILVPIANPDTVDRLLDTALDIAREREVPIVAFHVVEVPPQVPLTAGDQIIGDTESELLAYARDWAADVDVDIDVRKRFARDTATGIVGAVDAYDGAALLMGWRGRPRRRDIVLGSFLDRVLGHAPCDVYVKRIKQQISNVESILVPVAGGPHDELAVELAGTIASQHDARIVLLHVANPDAADDEESHQTTLLERRRKLLSSDLAVEEKRIDHDHVAGAITDETGVHDLTILGATRDPFLRRRLVGSVAQGVGRSASSPVIVTRKHLENS